MAGFLDSVFGGSKQQSNDDNNNQNQNNQNNQNQNQNDNNNDNNNDNLDSQTNIWEDKNQSSDDNKQNQNQNQNQDQNTIDPTEAMANHIASLNLTDGIDLAQIQSDMQTGDSGSLNKAFETIAANTYQASLTQMNKLMDGKIAAATEKATQDANASMNANMAVREMNTQLPFTTDPNIAPVAKAVLNQFINNGAELTDAIKSTQKYFDAVGEKVNSAGKSAGDQPGGGNFNRNTNSNNNDQSGQKTHDDWLDVLAQS